MKLNLDYIHNILLEIESTSAKAIFLSPNFSQDIYNLLGIAGFLLSAILFLSQLVTHRSNISLKIYDYKKIATIVQIFINIQNNSSASLCIHSFSIINGSKIYLCELIPKKIRGHEETLCLTPMFPLNLAPYQGYQCFLEFLFCEDIQLGPGKTLALKIHTNRGVIDKSVILGNISHYLHTRK